VQTPPFEDSTMMLARASDPASSTPPTTAPTGVAVAIAISPPAA
jgi:hypothetical protein